MGGARRNGNISKGNKGKKARRRIDPYAEYNDEEDRYGRVYTLSGSEHLEVELASPGDDGETIVTCRIPGKFYKKIWFKKHDMVVVGGKFSDKVYELKGKVRENEVNRVKRMFDGTDNNNEDMCVQIGGDEDECEEDADDMALGIKTRTTQASGVSRNAKSISEGFNGKDEDDGDSDSSSIDLDDL